MAGGQNFIPSDLVVNSAIGVIVRHKVVNSSLSVGTHTPRHLRLNWKRRGSVMPVHESAKKVKAGGSV